MEFFSEVLADTVIDALKLFPFLFLTYVLMEFLEHHTGEKSVAWLKRSGKFGPVVGAVAGIFPQCGFSAAASNLYAGRIISLGTLLAVYLSTSDEMLPILISEKIAPQTILRILAVKVITGIVAGILIDALGHVIHRNKDKEYHIHELCEKEHCHCEDGILKSALRHSLQILAFIFVLTFIINYFMLYIGVSGIQYVTIGETYSVIVLASIAGLIPNCAASVALTQLYVGGMIGAGALTAGLLVGAGIGILVLLRVNKKPLENIKIIVLLWLIGVLTGCLVKALGIVF
jgi:hypothetical protein